MEVKIGTVKEIQRSVLEKEIEQKIKVPVEMTYKNFILLTEATMNANCVQKKLAVKYIKRLLKATQKRVEDKCRWEGFNWKNHQNLIFKIKVGIRPSEHEEILELFSEEDIDEQLKEILEEIVIRVTLNKNFENYCSGIREQENQ